MDPETITVVSGVVSTAASVGAFVVALVALVRTRRNKAAVLDAQVESDFVARVLAKVLRLMSEDAKAGQPALELGELVRDASVRPSVIELQAPAKPGFSSAMSELRSAVVEYDKLTPREKRMHDDGPWAGYDAWQRFDEEPNEEDPRRQ